MSYRSNGDAAEARLRLSVMKRLFFSALVALAGCHHPDASTAPKTTVATSAPAPAPAQAPTPPTCEATTTRAKPSSSGQAMVTGGDGEQHSLYWIKLEAKTQPARGTLFYLAGGPLSHMK